MAKITVLDDDTINQIAAGEVIERPAAVVKELVENSIDAGANAITVEIKEGGISLIRITDNGTGIDEEDMPFVFLRHSTSKIQTAEDLLSVTSLGFRGEALSSIAAISQVELVTKTSESFTGIRYLIDGGVEKGSEHIGCPSGTTFIIRNLFYNTPARRKFLKSPVTEAGYISDLVERIAVSHPDISFKFILNGQIKLHTAGNNNQKDVIYNVYGRDITGNLLELSGSVATASIEGYVAKPIVSRGNRNYENYFINGRYIKSALINKAIEEAFRPYIMLHRYPFTSLRIHIDSELIDVNVHPAKLEIRFKNGEELYQLIFQTIKRALGSKELIPSVTLTKETEQKTVVSQKVPEPFEKNRINAAGGYNFKENKPRTDISSNDRELIRETEIGQLKERIETAPNFLKNEKYDYNVENQKSSGNVQNVKWTPVQNNRQVGNQSQEPTTEQTQTQIKEDQLINLKLEEDIRHSDYNHNLESQKQNNENFMAQEIVTDENDTSQEKNAKYLKEESNYKLEDNGSVDSNQLSFISEEAVKEHRIIGQVFKTYWLVEYGDKMFMIDQHAAHEKVLYEKIMNALKTNEHFSQQLLPPLILSLSIREEEALKKHWDTLSKLGFEIEEFGGKEYAVRGVPGDLYSLAQYDILIELIDGLVEEVYNDTPEIILEKIASLSCKAAVKGNHKLSYEEAKALIAQLLELENPYNCPHGRPVIVSMSKYELEKKFKRIV